jgi:hypothetical protein
LGHSLALSSRAIGKPAFLPRPTGSSSSLGMTARNDSSE